MYELIQAGEKTYYIDCPAKIGIYRVSGDEVCLIDSGNDKNAGKKALRILEEQGWKLKMILNTHFHADHIGGNEFLQQRTGCIIYGWGSDRVFTECPVLEPAFLFGAYPPEELRHKALMAKASQVTELKEENLPEGLSLIPLPGHSDGQFGLRTDDDVIFLADSLVGENILKKYRISHIFDVRRYLETLKKVKDLEAKLFVPAHGTVCSDIRPLAEANIQNTLSVMEDILSLCAEKISFDDCMARIFEKYGLPFDMVQYSLNSCTIKSMLSYLHEEGKVEIVTEDNHLYWRSCQEL